ncbi:YciK family oxidoreductase [Shewanella yunxiaonensis]|uniref:YciK family oxidoreductase n=1 Tax=Shewanella yunxiaonensis TaxID=2829809 RepID=A0ABX7YXU8_9GAMM|nr:MULTISPECIES: YciK family oxidoreductase [Shewanella]MDF0535110.1 YciK family oxidoreductase [Shewanella sp. A32]QUN07171.1 YciK family oxidoreductase [Shewanella yunxiaonensis]
MLDYQAKKDLLTNKIILVTGAGDGIGRTAAITYAAHGATVILLGRTQRKLEAVYDQIVAQGYPQPAIMPLDLASATVGDYQHMAALIDAQFGRLDGLLHNASLLGTLTLLEQLPLQELELLLKVNVVAELAMTQALLPLLRQASTASILFTSSGVGRKGRAYWGAYAISKFATEGMMQVLADEIDGSSVRANSINPGGTRTTMRASAYPAEDPLTLKTPQEIMPLYLYLMGDDSLHENGQAFSAQLKPTISK